MEEAIDNQSNYYLYEYLSQDIVTSQLNEDYSQLSNQLDFQDSCFDYQDTVLYDFLNQDFHEDIANNAKKVGVIDESAFISLENNKLDVSYIHISDQNKIHQQIHQIDQIKELNQIQSKSQKQIFIKAQRNQIQYNNENRFTRQTKWSNEEDELLMKIMLDSKKTP